jgi:hypothetical protein
MRKKWMFLIMVGLMLSLMFVIKGDKHLMLSPVILKPTRLNDWMKTQSKAQLVSLVNQNVSQIHNLERTLGKTGKQGYKIYASNETKELIDHYQELVSLLCYLSRGNSNIEKNQWEGYPFSQNDDLPYQPKQISAALSDLIQNKVPGVFLKGLRIYILPYAIPGVSGLGGPGYILLSAQNTHEVLIDNQLLVTLYHEIGHHVNFTFMPKDNPQGAKLWAEFLKIRGGSWHGPGAVNTKAWGRSSEETFAEDFRMLFGSRQPYFGDLALGDPRADWKKAVHEKEFLIHLENQKIRTQYHSPWISEEGLAFWQNQSILLLVGWGMLFLAIFVIRSKRSAGQGRGIFRQTKSIDSF